MCLTTLYTQITLNRGYAEFLKDGQPAQSGEGAELILRNSMAKEPQSFATPQLMILLHHYMKKKNAILKVI
jgi:hypothetical protein